ncbi:MAG: aerobic carbon-monoxide dehydrogenase medium subunit [Bradyrhizobium sp.]|jgi:carbon-monoxide dehydrogenase medium subunit|nr:aerobic carbon-monoxide dehydrogenase medium subunit [Bradyrhizobium sp.]
MKSARFTRHVPQNLTETVVLLGELQDECRILAGGQSLVPMMAFRMAMPPNLIDINEIPNCNRLRVERGELVIDPLVRHGRFRRDAAPGPTGALLAQVMGHIAHYPIRTRGTFCGSLAHADPASEWCLVAVTLDVSVQARSIAQTRMIAADDLFEGLMSTSLAPDEMIVAAHLPLLAEDARWGFYEFSRRPGDYAIAMSLASYVTRDGAIAEARIGVGGAEARPRRLTDSEQILNGQPPSPELFRAAADCAADLIDPMEDIQADAGYRRDLVRAVVRRALEASL